MPVAHRSSHPQSRRTSSGSHLSRRHSSHSLREPVWYFSGAILLLIIVKLLHATMLAPATGAIGIILLAISKQWRFRPGIIVSIGFMVVMVMLFAWQWVDQYFPAIISAGIVTQPILFRLGVIDSLIMVIIVWTYQRQLKAIHIRMHQKWFVKKAYVRFFKLLFYFHLFLGLFWISAYLLLKFQPATRLTIPDTAMIAGGLALLCAGIPAIIYISRGYQDSTKRHRHRHHHRHAGNELSKNADSL